MVQERQSQQDYFRTIMMTVVGQAFDAASYRLENTPLQWIGGKYRFVKSFDNDLYGFIDFQTLIYTDSMWSSGAPSRFRVQLTRSDDAKGRATDHPQYVTRSLSQLVVDDFGVNILPSADYWWSYHDTDSLGKGLAEAGHLAVGYGLPWLAGDLIPPNSAT